MNNKATYTHSYTKMNCIWVIVLHMNDNNILAFISEWSSEEGAFLLVLILLLHVVLLLLLPPLHLQSAHHLLQHCVLLLLLLRDAWRGSAQRGPEARHGDGAPQPPHRLRFQPPTTAAVLPRTPTASEGQRSALLLKSTKEKAEKV